MNTRNQLISVVAGCTFVIAGCAFIMSAEGQALPAVELNGIFVPESEAVEIDGVWYPKDDCVVTHDGSYALREDCKEVYTGSAWPTSVWAESDHYTFDQLSAAEDAGDVCYVIYRNAFYATPYCVWSDDSEEWVHISEVIEVDGEYYGPDSSSICCDGNGTWFLSGDDDWVGCSDGEYWPTDECHDCPDDGAWVYGNEEDCECCGRAGERINRYHSSPSPYLHRGASGWLVGFEIEKTEVDGCSDEGDCIEELPLFSGWETDSSCGVEGITHAYDPLDPSTRATFRRHLQASSEYVDGPTNSDCGGHINLSSNRLSSYELFCGFRKYAGLYYALYKGRLTNPFCEGNKALLCSSDKYVTVKGKPFGIELRLVSRVPDSAVLGRRFDLIAATCAAIDNSVSFNEALRLHKEVLLESYSGNRVKVASVMRLARHFQKWLDTNVSHPSIERYIG